MPSVEKPLQIITEKYRLSVEEKDAVLARIEDFCVSTMHRNAPFTPAQRIKLTNATFDMIEALTKQYREEAGTGL